MTTLPTILGRQEDGRDCQRKDAQRNNEKATSVVLHLVGVFASSNLARNTLVMRGRNSDVLTARLKSSNCFQELMRMPPE